VLDSQSTGYVTILKSVSAFLAHMCHMQTFTSGSAVENEPATRNDLRILATRIDRRFAMIDSQFPAIRLAIKEESLNLKESFRMEMYKFAAAVIGTGVVILGLTGFFSR
jgi:hypothetical protein